MEIATQKITKQNKDELTFIALSKYFGEKCLFCGREYKTLEDLKDSLWVGQGQDRRLVCSGCWQVYGQNT